MKTGPGFDAAHNVGIEEANDIAAEDASGRHHHAGIDPVIEVRAPADDELCDAGVLEHLVLGQEGLLRVVVAGTGAGIELGDFGVGHGGGQAEQQGARRSQPHGRRGGWLARDSVFAWMQKVSQRKAPGAMRAIALLVSPVRPRVACICGAFCSAMSILLDVVNLGRLSLLG